MTAIIGTFALGLALAVALYGCVASFVSARTRNAALVESARASTVSLFALVLAGFIAAVAIRFRRRRPEMFPWALGTMFAVSAFYLVLVLGPTSPFATLETAPHEGRGPLPLLQNQPLMAIHP